MLKNAFIKLIVDKDKFSGNVDVNSLSLKMDGASVSVPNTKIIMDTKDIEDISFSLKELIELCKKDDFYIRIYAQDKDDYETTVEIRPNKPFDMHSSIKQYLETIKKEG